MIILIQISLAFCYLTFTSVSSLPTTGEQLGNVECGVVPHKPNKIGPLDDFDYPWLAAIGYSGVQFSLKATGVLISARHVLTSRLHIQDGLDSKRHITHVRLGDYDLKSEYDDSNPVDYFITDVILPPLEDDEIVILVLDRNVTFNDHVRPICLPNGLSIKDIIKKSLPVVSYGHNLEDIAITLSVPYEDTAIILHQKLCEDKFKYKIEEITPERYFCAGVKNLNSCDGEIGAPVQYLNPTINKWTVVGLLSESYSCSRTTTNQINIISNVMGFLPFINESIFN